MKSALALVLEEIQNNHRKTPKYHNPQKIVHRQKHFVKFWSPIQERLESISVEEVVKQNGIRLFRLYGHEVKVRMTWKGKRVHVEIEPTKQQNGGFLFKFSALKMLDRINFWLLISAVFKLMKDKFARNMLNGDINELGLTIVVNKGLTEYRWRTDKEKEYISKLFDEFTLGGDGDG